MITPRAIETYIAAVEALEREAAALAALADDSPDEAMANAIDAVRCRLTALESLR